MIVAALELMQSVAAPIYAEVLRLPPDIAGDLVLRDQKHGRIEAIEAPSIGLNAREVIDAQLVEQPISRGPGCVRRRWTTTFRTRPGKDPGIATFETIYSADEIALSTSQICSAAHYARLNPGVNQEEGFSALLYLQRIWSSASAVKIDCSDKTSSDLCSNDQRTRLALSTLSPWCVSRDGAVMSLWLGTPGGIVTEVRFFVAVPEYARVTRYVPAPF